MPDPQRILLIEDDRLQYVVTERMLANARMARFETTWAKDFDEGLRMLTSGEFAACLLDYQLGKRDGLELLREARAAGCHTPVIFLTADSSEQIDEAAMQAGASDYLVKGEISPRLLERSIRYSLKLGAAMRELRLLATRDPLTGLLNRRAFDAELAEEIDRARRLGRALSLVLLDLDHFKRVNDTCGHPAGDALLRQVAAVLAREVRSIDKVARLGGEEFAVLLLETEGADAVSVATRLVDVVRASRFEVGVGEPLATTISAGVIAARGEALAAQDLVAAADKALYEAKRAGRDRAVLAT